MNGPRHHAMSYIELGADNLKLTRKFYESAFGWKFNDYGPEYSGIRALDGDGEVGGLNTQATPRGEGVLVLLYSDNLEATRDAVGAAGGLITAEPYEYPGGRRFEFTDPSGNRLGVYSTDA